MYISYNYLYALISFFFQNIISHKKPAGPGGPGGPGVAGPPGCPSPPGGPEVPGGPLGPGVPVPPLPGAPG